MFCGEPSALLCDFVLGRDLDKLIDPGEPAHGGKPGRPPGTLMYPEEPSFTCDAPMCRGCAKSIGHICGRPHFHDTIDLCPVHDKQDSMYDMRRAIRASEAEAYRNRMKMVVANGTVPTHDELRRSLGWVKMKMEDEYDGDRPEGA